MIFGPFFLDPPPFIHSLEILLADDVTFALRDFMYVCAISFSHSMVHTRDVYLSKGVIRYHERWDNKYGTCVSGGRSRRGEGEGVMIMAIQEDATHG